LWRKGRKCEEKEERTLISRHADRPDVNLVFIFIVVFFVQSVLFVEGDSSLRRWWLMQLLASVTCRCLVWCFVMDSQVASKAVLTALVTGPRLS